MHKPIATLALILAISLCCMTVACRHDSTDDIPVARLDVILSDYDSMDYARQIDVLDSLRPELTAMFAVLGIDDISTHTLQQWSASAAVEVFQPAVDSVYGNTGSLESQIGHILAKARAESLQLPSLRFATVTWGNPRPIVRVDSVILIALNHFLGKDYPGYRQWPEFRRADKTPEQLPYTLAAVLAATQYPMAESHGTTLLSWMLYEGVLVEAKMRLVNHASLDEALGYTPEQLKFVEDNTDKIWQEMAINKLIYDTDPATIQRYIGNTPSTPLLQGRAPGRIGRYIGYLIVRSYLDRHKGTSLRLMLTPEFYDSQSTLIESGFRAHPTRNVKREVADF